MKELMQHLLDGGKLVDERGDELELRNDDGKVYEYSEEAGFLVIPTLEDFIAHLAKHTFEKLETYEDGFYWVMWEDDSVERRVAFHESKTWHKISHENGVLVNNKNPHRVIKRFEP